MRTRAWIAAAALVAVASPSLAAHKGKIDNWEEPQAGMAKANAKGLPMMMFFTADW
ncbi:MAG: hypothetical protein R3F62_01020 [Planctomycetota bacterium]